MAAAGVKEMVEGAGCSKTQKASMAVKQGDKCVLPDGMSTYMMACMLALQLPFTTVHNLRKPTWEAAVAKVMAAEADCTQSMMQSHSACLASVERPATKSSCLCT